LRDPRIDRLVLAPDEPGPRDPRGARDGRHPRVRPASGQPPLLRPRGAPLSGRPPGTPPRPRRPAPASPPFQVSRPWPPGPNRIGGALAGRRTIGPHEGLRRAVARGAARGPPRAGRA